MNKNSKQRLFEVMGRLDKTFKPTLNEEMNQLETGDSYKKIINDFQGHAKDVNPIDSPQYKWYERVFNFINGNNNIYEKEELIKFFQNEFLGLDYDVLQTPAEIVSWWLSPEQQEFINNEINPDLTEVNNIEGTTINPKYTHFAVLKDSKKIINGWDYNGVESSELKQFKKDYFFNDIIEMGIDPKLIAIYTTKRLQKEGINPFDINNWQNTI